MNRICIYTKDIQIITGKGERQSREIIKLIRQYYNKEKHQLLSIYEVCEYFGLDVEKVLQLLR